MGIKYSGIPIESLFVVRLDNAAERWDVCTEWSKEPARAEPFKLPEDLADFSSLEAFYRLLNIILRDADEEDENPFFVIGLKYNSFLPLDFALDKITN